MAVDVREKQPDKKVSLKRLVGSVLLAFVLAGAVLVAESATESKLTGNDLDGVLTQERKLGVAHDEIIMLLISMVVAVQIILNFEILQRLPYKFLLLSSFGAVVLSTFFTVTESLVLSEVLNFLEHFSFMIASILLAVWCKLVFSNAAQEGTS